jgi:alkylated DNA repair dioxygenase AlkB
MNQLELFGSSKPTSSIVDITDGQYQYLPDFYSYSKASEIFKILRDEIAWKQESMNMYGREILFPRLTAWYGDSDKPYSFSGITLRPSPWTETLTQVREDVAGLSSVRFNSVLLNRYRDGNDSISWHTDAEKELGQNPIIASVNFGAERIFQLRHIKTGERIDIPLKHGSVLIMQGTLQHFWQHQVPKTKKPLGERINLTFRYIR